MKPATVSYGECNPPYSLHIGRWDDPERMVLRGFDSAFDAWAFAICNGLDDPNEGVPEKFRQWTNKPKADVLPEGQMTLFAD